MKPTYPYEIGLGPEKNEFEKTVDGAILRLDQAEWEKDHFHADSDIANDLVDEARQAVETAVRARDEYQIRGQ